MKNLTRDEVEAIGADVSKSVGGFVSRLLMQGDRTAVILGAARLDVALEAALRAIMRHHPGGQDNLFDSERPLGTLSAKIALAFRLGVIDEDTEHALQVVRKIRNEFAHSIEDESFSLQRHRDRLRSSTSRASQTPLWREMAEAFKVVPVSETLKEFAQLLIVLIVNLEVFARVEDNVTVLRLSLVRPAG